MADDGRTRDELLLAAKEFLFPAVFHYYKSPLVIERAKNQYVWDSQDRQYLDFFGGIATISVGHLNDDVNAAIHQQADRLQHVSTVFPTRPQVGLAERLARLSPGGQPTKSFFTNSGSEANETAIELARCYTGNSEIVALRHSYHGRTPGGRSASGQSSWRGPGPAAAGIVHAHNAYCYRCPFGKTYPSCELACARDVKELIETSTSGKLAGFIAEPIQGLAGFITPPREYFKIVTDIVREHGGIFISDEVQSACGRTGKWFGIEHYDVVPDVITLAKGLGNGLPVGATVARAEVADSMRYLTFSTFGGNPVTTAAASAVVDFIAKHDLLANSAQVGAYLANQLTELHAEFPVIGDVRGAGLMQALELVSDRETKEPAARAALLLMEEMKDRGVLIGRGGLYGNVIRLSPPLNISTADVDALTAPLRASLAALDPS